MSELRVAQLNLSGAWGGLEMSTARIAAYFHEQKFASFGLCPEQSPLGAELKKLGVTVLDVPLADHLSLNSTLKLRRAIIKNNINVIFAHQLRNLWILVPALIGLPEVRVIGFARMFLRGVNKKDALHTMLYRRLEKLIAFNSEQLGALLKCLPITEDRCLILPNGVDLERFHPEERDESLRSQEWKLAADGLAIGLVGRIDPQKGHREFIEAAALVKKRIQGIKFIVVGGESVGESGFLQTIRSRARELGMESSVIFMGERADIPKIMASLDVFALASYEEAFGQVTIEAMASGVPVIATNSGGSPEIVQQNETGLLVEPKSAEQLAEAMIKLAENPELRHRLGRAGRARAEAVYDRNKVYSQIRKIAEVRT